MVKLQCLLQIYSISHQCLFFKLEKWFKVVALGACAPRGDFFHSKKITLRKVVPWSTCPPSNSIDPFFFSPMQAHFMQAHYRVQIFYNMVKKPIFNSKFT